MNGFQGLRFIYNFSEETVIEGLQKNTFRSSSRDCVVVHWAVVLRTRIAQNRALAVARPRWRAQIRQNRISYISPEGMSKSSFLQCTFHVYSASKVPKASRSKASS